jgi:hypothetical protein
MDMVRFHGWCLAMRAHLSPAAGLRRLLLLCPLICCISCSGTSLYPVHGKLLHKGKPVGGATLVFHPKTGDANAFPPTASTEDDGTFTVTTQTQQGAPAGEYVVTVTCMEEVKTKEKKFDMGAKPEYVDRFKGAYAKAANSTIKVEIKKGQQELDPINLN